MNRNAWVKASFALNLILVIAVVWLAGSSGSHHSASEIIPEPPQAPATDGPDFARPAATSALTTASGAGAAGSDWRQWIGQLRAAGVPEKVLARLVLADFSDRWQKREMEYQQKYLRGEITDDAYPILSAEREREQEDELRAALGEEGFREWDKENVLSGLMGGGLKLTAGETNALYDVQKNLQRRLRDLELAKARGEIDQADCHDQQEKAQAEVQQRIKALLGDDRYAAMHGADDPTDELRRNLRNVNPTDTQFQSLLDVQKQWAERRAELDRYLQENKSMDGAHEEKLQALDAARDQEYQRVLGTNGFDAYQKAQDQRYATMKRYSDLWQMDDQSIDYVFRTIQYYEKTLEEYQRKARVVEQQGQSVDWDGIQKNIQQFSRQTEQMLQQRIGDDRFKKLQRNDIFPFVQ